MMIPMIEVMSYLMGHLLRLLRTMSMFEVTRLRCEVVQGTALVNFVICVESPSGEKSKLQGTISLTFFSMKKGALRWSRGCST